MLIELKRINQSSNKFMTGQQISTILAQLIPR